MRPLSLLLCCCLSLAARSQNPPPKSVIPVVETTIATIPQALKNKTCSCEGLVGEYLRRIDAYDRSTGLNAIVLTNPD
ncbi:MAG TPA: hypothetical protein VNW04_00940, partial [Puia sp.]|nr:hypothetical protein [Puia sp.]